jgi:hypothetical protein
MKNCFPLLIFAFFLTVCAGSPDGRRPDWISHPPAYPYFTGQSGEFENEQGARYNAERDAAIRIAMYYGYAVDYKHRDSYEYFSSKGKPEIEREQIESNSAIYANSWVSRIQPIEYYTEHKRNKYIVYVKVVIPQEMTANQDTAAVRNWNYAQVVFKGDQLSWEDRQALFDALDLGIQQNRIPVYLVFGTNNESNVYSFEITLTSKEPDYPIDKNRRRYTVTIGFIQNGIRRPFAQDQFVELGSAYALYKAAMFIRTDKTFYQELRLRLVL